MAQNPEAARGIHQGQPVLAMGVPLQSAHAAMIMAHGRGARAEDILTLVPYLEQPGFAYLAPRAANNAWYPNPFLAPIEANEPWLSSALHSLEEVFSEVTQYVPPERVIWLGFSQGASLTLEYVARHARRYGGVVGLSGSILGPMGTPRSYPGSFEGTPIFLGCSDVDPYIPKEYVEESARVLSALGAQVTMRIYPNMGHTTNEDEMAFVNSMMAPLAAQ